MAREQGGIVDERGLTDEARRPEPDDDYTAACLHQAIHDLQETGTNTDLAELERLLDRLKKREPVDERLSVVPDWISSLPLQQQSVLLLAARGPDGAGKDHVCKPLVRIYRGTVFRAARYGRLLSANAADGEGDTFMDRRWLRDKQRWIVACEMWVRAMEEMPQHYVTHFMHGVEILGYTHPDPGERGCWLSLYYQIVLAMHLSPESREEMDKRLGDWGRLGWDGATSDEDRYAQTPA